jgi:hypothetical protein
MRLRTANERRRTGCLRRRLGDWLRRKRSGDERRRRKRNGRRRRNRRRGLRRPRKNMQDRRRLKKETESSGNRGEWRGDEKGARRL